MPSGPQVALIAAVARNGVIGDRGTLPWRLPDDLARFRRLTMGRPVIMGRATFHSMGRPLPGRANVVLTRDPSLVLPGCTVVHSAEEALAAAGGGPAFVIGGASVYAAFLPAASAMHLTWIDTDVAGDTFFPPVAWEEWSAVREEGAAPGAGGLPHRFVDYERIAAAAAPRGKDIT